MTINQSLQSQINRLKNACAVYEHLLVALYNGHPKKESIRNAFEESARFDHSLMHAAGFDDEELQRHKRAIDDFSSVLLRGSADASR